MTENKREDLLSSWKEIAAYLGCDERTCLRWEKLHGLPVRRLNGGSKSRVYAFREELDRWLSEHGGYRRFRADKADPPRPAAGARRLRLLLGVAAGIAATGSLVAGLFFKPPISRPADFQIAGSRLRILDARGLFLWEFDTGLKDLAPEAYYRLHFQSRQITDREPARAKPLLMIRDLEGDGRPEVLFAPKSALELREGRLICFSADGRRRWSHGLGRPIRYGDRVFPADFATEGFDVFDADADGRLEILVSAHALHEFPTQISLLDAAGKLRGEYWNAGQVNDFTFSDLDGDGRPEILVAGIANEYERGMLLVLDPRAMRGGSPQKAAEFVSPELERGTEKAYVLLGLSPLDALFNPGVSALYVDVLEGGKIETGCGPSGLIFQLDRELGLARPVLGHTYERLYKRMLAEGRLRVPFDPERIESGIRADMRYWDGRGWTPAPAIEFRRPNGS